MKNSFSCPEIFHKRFRALLDLAKRSPLKMVNNSLGALVHVLINYLNKNIPIKDLHLAYGQTVLQHCN